MKVRTNPTFVSFAIPVNYGLYLIIGVFSFHMKVHSWIAAILKIYIIHRQFGKILNLSTLLILLVSKKIY
jgi:hypothetical protein